MFIVAVS